MKKYFLNINGKTVGPYSVTELRSMNIKPSTPVWYTGAVNWKNAETVPELQSLFNSDPFSVSDRPKQQYKPPRPRSTSFTQFNFEPDNEANKQNLKIGLIVGIIVVLVVCGAGYYLEKQKELAENNAEINRLVDTATENHTQEDAVGIDTSAVSEESPGVVEETSLYTGVYDNLKGGKLNIEESGSELKINLQYNLGTDEKCQGEISGTGTIVNDSTVSMTTSDGCILKLNFRSRYTISLEESGDCKSYHGKHCLFDGVYYGQ
jgi:hypothetical protein